MSLCFLILLSLVTIAHDEDVMEPHIDVQVEVENSTTIHVKWDSHLHSVMQCVLVIFVKGSKEDEIFLLPRNGSLKLTDRKTGTLYTINVNCFNGETILKSSNISIDTGVAPSTHPATSLYTSGPQTQSTSGNHLNHAKLLSSDVLTGAVFGCIGGVILIYMSYSFYKKWRMDERLRAFLRLRRNVEVAPYFIFGENEENAG
ncbi:uncharacterized protein LOC132818988 isoform X1 [Hemiscyllium ocellatum]|uniref:uncharacterized protein LOC132818988 isoform X1 n=1 Tax=Hemiscyllium ocellatum TaxID=170820 RepID=UPI002966F4CD|nr:uncharacterized protein LOC132818988 isoform X1 [Hemiscyllium ocellatum]XP_060686188.1 uncharacterized protein LOC132818988 isoform X1 [Hemiscyllium ocellatum]XP_060686197.1 uncharacterized protein LOC132818988 isoform X1 [Hemiscyllium ocellatum]